MAISKLYFTKAELNQLLSYCEARDREDWYYGNKEQFEKRHFEISTKIEKAIKLLEERGRLKDGKILS